MRLCIDTDVDECTIIRYTFENRHVRIIYHDEHRGFSSCVWHGAMSECSQVKTVHFKNCSELVDVPTAGGPAAEGGGGWVYSAHPSSRHL